VKRLSLGAAGLLVVVVVISYLTGSAAARRSTRPVGTAAVTSRTVVCPAISGSPASTSTVAAIAGVGKALSPAAPTSGTLASSFLAGAKSKVTKLHPAPVATVTDKNGSGSVAAAASGALAASLGADELIETPTAGRYRGLLGSSCGSPATNWWFAGADGRVGYSDALIVANPAITAADVAVSLWTKKGPESPPHLDAVEVPAFSRVVLNVAGFAPDTATIAIHVHAESGAVVAALVDRRSTALKSDGGDFIPNTQPPARHAVIPGFPGGVGPRKLVLADPGPLDATVNLTLVTRSGTFAPSGVHQVVVHQQHATIVDLTKVFGGLAGAVELTSDHPVIGQGLAIATVTNLRPDLMWLASLPALAGPAAIANGRQADGGACVLVLTAPGATATVRVSTPSGHSRQISVPAGTTLGTDINSTIAVGKKPWPFVVTPVSGGPVYGVRILTFTGAHGALITSESLRALPRPIPLPAVRENPSVAVR
jgi:hypothetical protein